MIRLCTSGRNSGIPKPLRFRRHKSIPFYGEVFYAPHTCFPMFELIVLRLTESKDCRTTMGQKEKEEGPRRCERKEKPLGRKKCSQINPYFLLSNKLAHFRFAEDRRPIARGARGKIRAV